MTTTARTAVASSAPTPGTGSTPGTAALPTPGQADPPNNNSMTARYSSDLSNVCEGSPILNAAPYNGPAGAKAYTFSNNPDRPTSWSSKYVPSDKPYYAKSADYQKVSVVGCLKFDEGSEGAPKKCQYKDKAEKQVTIDYVSSRYTLTFYAAKTAEKIGDGGTVTAPTEQVPEFHLVRQDHHEGVRDAGLRHHRGGPGQVPVLRPHEPGRSAPAGRGGPRGSGASKLAGR